MYFVRTQWENDKFIIFIQTIIFFKIWIISYATIFILLFLREYNILSHFVSQIYIVQHIILFCLNYTVNIKICIQYVGCKRLMYRKCVHKNIRLKLSNYARYEIYKMTGIKNNKLNCSKVSFQILSSEKKLFKWFSCYHDVIRRIII